MKKITIDARMVLSSGIGTYLQNLLPRLQNRGLQFQLIVHPSALEKVLWLREFDIKFCLAPIYSIAEQMQLRYLIEHCDVFWSPHMNIPLLPIKARRRLVTIHDVYHLAFFKCLNLLQKGYTKAVFAHIERSASRVITVSAFSKSELLKYTSLSPQIIAHIANGVDQDYFTQVKSSEEFAQLQRKYGLPEQFILFVGNLKPHKNLQSLVKAFHYLRQKRESSVGLVMVGRRVNLHTCENSFLYRHQDVFILEDIDNAALRCLYQHAAVFILPSFYEGFGLTPLEAMSVGCPVVVSKVASLPEVCKDAAEYVNPYEFQDIAQGIERVLTDPLRAEELKRKGLEISRLFSWDESANQHMQILKECSEK